MDPSLIVRVAVSAVVGGVLGVLGYLLFVGSPAAGASGEGAEVVGVVPGSTPPAAKATLFTGLSFGDQPIRIGFRAEYIIGDAWWAELADDAGVLATVGGRL